MRISMADPFFTSYGIQIKLKKCYGVNVSAVTVRRHLRDLHGCFTQKKALVKQLLHKGISFKKKTIL